jgi:hypothetical protein
MSDHIPTPSFPITTTHVPVSSPMLTINFRHLDSKHVRQLRRLDSLSL